MPMPNYGLNKLAEECAEIVVIKEKADTLGHLGDHWDGKGNLLNRLEDEIADACAAMDFVIDKLKMDWQRIGARKRDKKILFEYWDQGGTENKVPADWVPNLQHPNSPFPKQSNVVKTGQVYMSTISPHTKCVARMDREFAWPITIISDSPHEDGDFSYICNNTHCRCQS